MTLRCWLSGTFDRRKGSSSEKPMNAVKLAQCFMHYEHNESILRGWFKISKSLGEELVVIREHHE
jgi:hypothetical protein